MKPSFPLQLLWNSQTLATAPTSTLFITFMVWELYNYFRLITSLPMLVGAHFAQNCADTDETIWYSTRGCELTPIRELRRTDAVDKSMVGILHITNLRLCSGFSRREKKIWIPKRDAKVHSSANKCLSEREGSSRVGCDPSLARADSPPARTRCWVNFVTLELWAHYRPLHGSPPRPL